MTITVFLFAGALTGIAGGLFANLQTYITRMNTFSNGLFFIAVLISGTARSSTASEP
jgi:hypothetical protein